jgi:hypothetical protein
MKDRFEKTVLANAPQQVISRTALIPMHHTTGWTRVKTGHRFGSPSWNTRQQNLDTMSPNDTYRKDLLMVTESDLLQAVIADPDLRCATTFVCRFPPKERRRE